MGREAAYEEEADIQPSGANWMQKFSTGDDKRKASQEIVQKTTVKKVK